MHAFRDPGDIFITATHDVQHLERDPGISRSCQHCNYLDPILYMHIRIINEYLEYIIRYLYNHDI
jgi:hypothetical protein